MNNFILPIYRKQAFILLCWQHYCFLFYFCQGFNFVTNPLFPVFAISAILATQCRDMTINSRYIVQQHKISPGVNPGRVRHHTVGRAKPKTLAGMVGMDEKI